MPTTPKRESELQRPRSRKGGNAPQVTRGQMMPTQKPAMDPKWHPIAKKLFISLGKSGQVAFFQNSDWAMAYSIVDDLSRYKHAEDKAHELAEKREHWESLTKAQRRAEGLDPDVGPRLTKGGSAVKLQTIMSALGTLMVTESDRRRIHLELHEPPQEGEKDAKVVALAAYQKALDR